MLLHILRSPCFGLYDSNFTNTFQNLRSFCIRTTFWERQQAQTEKHKELLLMWLISNLFLTGGIPSTNPSCDSENLKSRTYCTHFRFMVDCHTDWSIPTRVHAQLIVNWRWWMDRYNIVSIVTVTVTLRTASTLCASGRPSDSKYSCSIHIP